MSVVIYHNPACGTSRKVLARLKEAGREPEVIVAWRPNGEGRGPCWLYLGPLAPEEVRR